ncbi:DUF4350 domain-containing protein [Ruicaihuangia caeni]|uniref:DUF4350 domain-containing protein n=1 Tax=Ruicaihuangia caeni TaxID=3042517 RepID=A0AAW6T9H4_9MICO|nr:DUF4350 domain-containing protein [Klugiella sp. YN-L-19]MDI2099446.1 DUF4350 domain-containing protein [Klugiella sp. YN-L-19]
MTVLTPAARTVARRTVFWVAAATFVVLIGLLMMAMAGSSAESERLAPSSAAPAGARAVTEVLRDNGIEVVEAESLAEVRDTLDGSRSGGSTLLVHDVRGILEGDRLQELAQLGDRLVLLEPDFAALDALAPALALAGSVEGPLDAECSLRAALNAGTVTGDGQGYRVIDADANATACFGSGDDIFSLVELAERDRSVTVLGATAALTNELVAAEGNAALALTLLGERPTLVWYVPGPADLPASDAPITAYLPHWVSVISIALLAVGIAAAFWRGRRLGPLVVEQLPVVVPSGEVTEGRARLYERNATRLHAIDSLRIATIERLARRCGLPRTATVDEVAAAVAAIAGRPIAHVRAALVDSVPGNDAELVRLSDELLRLEDAVERALGGPRAERGSPASGHGSPVARSSGASTSPTGKARRNARNDGSFDERHAPDERNTPDHG